MDIKSIGGSLTSNPIGAIAGGVAAYLLAKKVGKVENKYAVIGITVAGVIAGAMAQSKLRSKATVKPAITAVTK